MRPYYSRGILYRARTIRRAFDFGINESVKCASKRIPFLFFAYFFLYYCNKFILLLLYGRVLPVVYTLFHDDDDRKALPIGLFVFTIVSRKNCFRHKKKNMFFQKFKTTFF